MRGNVLYPSSYDGPSSLFGAAGDNQIFTVKYPINVDAMQITVNEDLSLLALPAILVFFGGEIWYVREGDVAQNGLGDWVIQLSDPYQRAINGSQLQPHSIGEEIYTGFTADTHVTLKRALIAAQKYGFIIGTESARSITNPSAGMAYFCSDSGKVYYCFVDDTWVWVNRATHATVAGAGQNDHPQYAQVADFAGQHDFSGHVTNGDNHDHTSPNQGAPIQRVRSGLAADQGYPVCVGDTYFSVDVGGDGRLSVSVDGVSWTDVSGVPSGAIAAFSSACPDGWVRYTELDNRIPLAANTPGESGGTVQHKHVYDEIVQHYHSVSSSTVSLSTIGTHSHVLNRRGNAGSQTAPAIYGGTGTEATTTGGAHTHSVVVLGRATDYAGAASAETELGSTLPPYQEVVFCKKV